MPTSTTSSRLRLLLDQPCTHYNRVVGFLPLHEWEPFLSLLQDQCFAAFLRRGISSGFRLGFNPASILTASKSNSPSATSLSSKVNDYLRDEVETGNLGNVADSSSTHINPIGFIPKKNKPGKYKLLVNLSAPEGASVNDGISSVASSLSLHLRKGGCPHDPSRGLPSQDQPKGCLQEGPSPPRRPIPTRHLPEGPDTLRQGPSFRSEICPPPKKKKNLMLLLMPWHGPCFAWVSQILSITWTISSSGHPTT